MLRSLESIRVEPQALGLQSNLKDEGTNPADKTAGRFLLRVVELGAEIIG